MRNYKILAVLTAFLFLMNWQTVFAQTIYNFDCSSFFPNSQSCTLTSPTDMTLVSAKGINVWHGRPRVSETCNRLSLLLNYWYDGNNTHRYGSDGVSLRYTFVAGRRYQIKYKIAVSRNMQFVLDFISTPSISSTTLGNITNATASTAGTNAQGYLFPSLPANSVNMQRLESFGSNGPGSLCYSEGASPCEFLEKTFEYSATTNGEFLYLRLDRSGYDADGNHVEIKLDDICIGEIPNPDFNLEIWGRTGMSDHGPNPPPTDQGPQFRTQNTFNFTVRPVDPVAASYKLEVFRSSTVLNSTTFPLNIVDGDNVPATNPIFSQTRPNADRVFDTRDSYNNQGPGRSDAGFLVFEKNNPQNYYYRIRLTVTKDGIERFISRVVKVGYLTNINIDPLVNRYWNPGFNFTVKDNGVGLNRTRTFTAFNNRKYSDVYNRLTPNPDKQVDIPSSPTHWWVGAVYDTNQFGAFDDSRVPWEPTTLQGTNNNYSNQFSHPVTQIGEFVKVRTANVHYNVNPNIVSKCDGLIVYDRLELQDPVSACTSGTSLNELPASLAQKVITKGYNDLNIFPNPASEQTIIKYNLSQSGKVSVYLTDITGKKVAELVQNKKQEAGNYEVLFLRKDMINGMYFVVMENEQGKVVKKLILN